MPITEKLMAPGSFSVSLLPETSVAVRAGLSMDLYPWSYVVICDNHHQVADLSAADLLAQSVYTGVLRKRTDGGRTLHGAGLCVLLGDEDGKGDLWLAADFDASTSRTFQDHITAILLANGITAGTIGADSSAAFQFTGDTGDTQREWLDQLRVMKPGTDFEWRINPDGTLDSDTAANLWTSGAVMFSASPSGRDSEVTGLHAQLSLEAEDAEDIARRTAVDWNSAASIQSAFSSAPIYALDGSALVTEAYMTNRSRRPKPSGSDWRKYRAWAAQAAAEALKAAEADIADRTTPRLEVSVAHTEYAPWRFYSVGDTVYIWDVDQGLINTSNQVQFRGETTFPATTRIEGHTTPIYEGYGVYHYRSDGAAGMEFVDITDYVQFESGTTKLEVGATRRTLAG